METETRMGSVVTGAILCGIKIQEVLMGWRNKKVLICGGAGMIGAHLARRLVKQGANVLVVDNLSSGSEKNIADIRKDIDFWGRDLRSVAICHLACKERDVVFQLAANMGGIGFITSIGADIMRDSALINLNTLEAARRCEVPLYFYSSSACIYPVYKQLDAEVRPLKETDAYPAEPDQFYGLEKLFTERLCEAYQKDYGMNIRVARFHNIFGACYTAFDKLKGKAPAHMIIKAIRHPKPSFVIWGDGKQTRSFCHIEDCIDGILRLMGSDYGKPVNIGSDRLISMTDLAKMAVDLTGKQVEFQYDLTKPQGVRGRNADLTLVRQTLNWEPRVSLEDGMSQVYQWAVEHYSELEGV